VRAALDQLIDFGRPARIELAVLVDRGHRELPIRADYVGRTLSTAHDESVKVLVVEEDGRDEVLLKKKRARTPRAATAKTASKTKRRAPSKRGKARASTRKAPKVRTKARKPVKTRPTARSTVRRRR